MKLSFLGRFITALLIITIGLIIIIWMVVLPKYKQSVISDQIADIQQLQRYAIDRLDCVASGWSDATVFIAHQVQEHPTDGELILRMMMTLHPEIIQIKIHSTNLSDELSSRNTSYPPLPWQVEEGAWVRSKRDSALQISWIHRSETPNQVLAMQMQFYVQEIPFTLFVLWDAAQLQNVLIGLPLGKDYSFSIHSVSHMVAHIPSSFIPFETLGPRDTANTHQALQQNGITWHVLTGSLQSAQLWALVAVPEHELTRDLENFTQFASLLIIGLMLLVAVLAWIWSHQINRLLLKMKSETIYSSEE